DPLAVDGDVAFEEVEARVLHEVGHAVRAHVHAIDLPAGVGEDALRKVVADESVDPEDADFLHELSPGRSGCAPKRAAKEGASIGAPSTSQSMMRNRPPSAHSATR